MKDPSPDRRPDVPAKPRRIAVWLIAAAVLSATALDVLQGRRGEPSYFLAPRAPVVEDAPRENPLAVDIRESLAASGFPGESPIPLPLQVGPAETAVLVPSDLYAAGLPAFETELAARGILIDTREEIRTDAFSGKRWRVHRGETEISYLLFLWPAEKKPELPVVPAKKAPSPRPGRVALVVDDMGHDLSALDVLIGLEERLTVAVLPHSLYAVQTAEIARKNGIEIMLHLPLEPLNNHETGDGAEGIIRSDMSRMTIRSMMEDYLARVPHIRGVNNHMGSRGTADAALMRLVLEPLKERNLFFLDSMTSPQSIAAATAREMGIPAATRSVFLDDGGDPLSVRDRLNELFRQARANGVAVGICHPYPHTLEVLKERFRGLRELGLEAVFISDIVSR